MGRTSEHQLLMGGVNLRTTVNRASVRADVPSTRPRPDVVLTLDADIDGDGTFELNGEITESDLQAR
jgi:hypothetical protein